MDKFPTLSLTERMRLLDVQQSGQVAMVIDSDTFNEIDDQFAIAWAALHPERIDLQAVYAAPFTNAFFGEGASHFTVREAKQGMELSYDEIHRVFDKLPNFKRPEIFKGSEQYLKDRDLPEESPAALDLIQRALNCEGVLQVVSIGAPTNIANALLIEPKIIHKIHVIWLGGNSFDWKDNSEFNLMQDIRASRILFDSGVALTQIPCFGVANCLATSVPEMQFYLSNTSRLGDYLAAEAPKCPWIGFASRKVIWDIAAVGFAMNSEWFTCSYIPAPMINDNLSWSFDNRRHLIRVVKFIERDCLFKDLFRIIMDADK